MTGDNVRLVSPSSGSEGGEFNLQVDGRQLKCPVRVDPADEYYWLVPREVGSALLSSPHSGFIEHADDESTLSELRLLISVIADRALAAKILAVLP